MTPLEQSIAHWERNVAANSPANVSTGVLDCALCTEHRNEQYRDVLCTGCPVAEKTGLNGCRGTPHSSAVGALYAWKADEKKRDNWRKAATEMLDFLKGLRS